MNYIEFPYRSIDLLIPHNNILHDTYPTKLWSYFSSSSSSSSLTRPIIHDSIAALCNPQVMQPRRKQTRAGRAASRTGIRPILAGSRPIGALGR